MDSEDKDLLLRLETKIDNLQLSIFTLSKDMTKQEGRMDTASRDIDKLFSIHRECQIRRDQQRRDDELIFQQIKSIQATYKVILATSGLVVSIGAVLKIFGVI